MDQPCLFRPTILDVFPSPYDGQDMKWCGRAEDDMVWALKLATEHPMLPISEWLGYKITEACGLPVPHHAVVRMPDGSTAFGSRIEGGVESTRGCHIQQLVSDYQACARTLTHALTCDVFMGNEDRHTDQFVWRRNDLGTRTPMPIDYSRALLVRGWPLQDIRCRICHTTTYIKMLRKIRAWRADLAAMTIGRIIDITPATLTYWVHQTPDDWLPEPARSNLVQWWGSESFLIRAQDCIDYCA